MTGPISAGVVTQAMAPTSSRLEMVRTNTMRPTGVIMAPPMPCRMRAMTKSVSELDSAQPIEPIMKTAMATRNTVEAPKRSAVQPDAGMNTASESRYEVTASLSASGLVPISAAIAGSEVAITVESMFSMNSATAMISGTMRSRRIFRWFRGGIGTAGRSVSAVQPQSGCEGKSQNRDRREAVVFMAALRESPRNRPANLLRTHANPKAGFERRAGMLPRGG